MPIVIPKWTAHGVANWNELLVEAGDGRRGLSEATAALLNYMPAIGITSLTQETAGDAWCRIAIHQALFSGLVKDSTNGKTYFLTRSDVFRHLGVETEGNQQSFGEFCEGLLWRAQLQDERESLFFIVNGRRSLLEVCGVASAEWKMSEELERFKQDLLKSVRQMRRGESARVTRFKVPEATEARSRTGLSQEQFARLLGVSTRTLQDWEQGRREPTGAAKTLLRVAYEHPEVLLKLER